MKTKVLKKIEWSYPSSSNAYSLGFAKSGCWTVETVTYNPDPQPPEAIKGFWTKEEAKRFADTLPHDWAAGHKPLPPLAGLDCDPFEAARIQREGK